jgi:hypothetical protein
MIARVLSALALGAALLLPAETYQERIDAAMKRIDGAIAQGPFQAT